MTNLNKKYIDLCYMILLFNSLEVQLETLPLFDDILPRVSNETHDIPLTYTMLHHVEKAIHLYICAISLVSPSDYQTLLNSVPNLLERFTISNRNELLNDDPSFYMNQCF